MGARSNVILVEETANAKLGGIATTHASRHTCPTSCPMKNSGCCYTETPPQLFVLKALTAHQARLKENHLKTARREAALIDGLNRQTDLRIHTVGDCKSEGAAKLVATASEGFMKRTGGKAYTYTHAWREVPRNAWGSVSVLASCETMADVKQAISRGYVAALVVPKHNGWKAYKNEGLNMLPCPAQTNDAKTCKQCRLCMRDDLLRKANAVVVFQAHGATVKVNKLLKELNHAN